MDYIAEAYNELAERQKNRPPILRLIEGENIVTINMSDKPIKLSTRFGDRIAIPVIDKNGNRALLVMSERGKLYMKLINALADVIKQHSDSDGNLQVELKIIKTGTGVDASYSVKVLNVIGGSK